AIVHQARYTANANQPAPRSCTDQRTQPRLAEVIRKSISSRSAPTVDQHHLWSVIGKLRPRPRFAIADGPEYDRRPVEHLNKPVRNLPSIIESFINDD